MSYETAISSGTSRESNYILIVEPYFLALISSEAVTRRCSKKKGILKNFAKFPVKYLCQSLFFNKVAGLRPALY